MSFRVEVKGRRDWFGVAVIVALFVVPIVITHGEIHAHCARPGADLPATCGGGTTTLYSHNELVPFTLEHDAFRVGKTKPNSRGYRYTALVAPTGQLESAALEPEFAQRVVAETNAFYENRSAREWHAERPTSWITSSIFLGVGGLVLALFFWLWRGVTIEIDPRGGFITCRNKVWPIADIEDVDPHDSWRWGSSLKLTVAGVPVEVFNYCQKESATAATEAIKRAIEGAKPTPDGSAVD